jgi:hypothetical protein
MGRIWARVCRAFSPRVRALSLVVSVCAVASCERRGTGPKRIPIRTHPIVLDRRAATISLPDEFRSDGRLAHLCLSVDTAAHELLDNANHTVHQRRPGQPARIPGTVPAETLEPGIIVSGSLQLTTGRSVALEANGFDFSIREQVFEQQFLCLLGKSLREGNVVSAVSLRATEPVRVSRIEWHVDIP